MTRDEDMPRDEFGNIADLVMDPMSLTKRMNIGRVIEPRVNSISMMVTKNLREHFGFPDKPVDEFSARRVVSAMDDITLDRVKRYLRGYYDTISPLMGEALDETPEFDYRSHLKHILMEGVQLWLPTNNPVDYTEAITELSKKGYHPNYNHVQFRGVDGTMKTTKKKVMVGSIYIILLEKIGRDFAAVASAKLQMNGVPSRISSTDRHSSPVRAQPVRIAGETEVRLFLMAIGGLATRDLLDRTNNPESHRMEIESILTADKPTDIDETIDRTRHPETEHRIMKQIEHLHTCGGIEHFLVNESELYAAR